MTNTEPDHMSPLRLAQRRAAYEHELERRSALVAIDVCRYESFDRAISDCWPMDACADETRVDVHLAETERLVGLVLASLARLAVHLDEPI